jgi:hypothetical protein
VVKDGAIPPEGRQVRCAACKHSWHQGPDEELTQASEAPAVAADAAEPVTSAAVEEPEEATAEPETIAEATLIEPRSGPEAEERAYEEAVIESGDQAPPVQQGVGPITQDEVADGTAEADPAVEAAPSRRAERDWIRPPVAEEATTDMFSPFAEDGEQPRRRSAATTIIVLLLLVIAAAAAFWFLAPPSMKAKLGLASAGTTPLQLVTTHMDRQHLESGNDLLTLTGRVINPSAKEQAVPPIQAQLKNKSGQVVYSWTIQPPAPTLAAGSSASFNSAEVSVPPGGDELTITLGDSKALGV